MVDKLSCAFSKEGVKSLFPKVSQFPPLVQQFVVRPLNKVLVIYREEENFKVEYMTWGLLPQSSKQLRNNGSLFQADAEGIASKPSFRFPIRSRRCIILADSFYHERKRNGETEFFRVYRRGHPVIALAGIWDEWSDEKDRIRTCALINCNSNADVQTIARKSPCLFFSEDDLINWMTSPSLSDIISMIHPVERNSLLYYQVTDQLANRSFNGPDAHVKIFREPSLFDL